MAYGLVDHVLKWRIGINVLIYIKLVSFMSLGIRLDMSCFIHHLVSGRLYIRIEPGSHSA